MFARFYDPQTATFEWDAAPMVWKIREDWKKRKINEYDYRMRLRSTLTKTTYKIVEKALEAFPLVEAIAVIAQVPGKLPSEIAKFESATLLRIKVSRSVVKKYGWYGLNDLFPPRELIDEVDYQRYLEIFPD